MALRVRSRAPQDENAALPHLSGKMQLQHNSSMPMMSKSMPIVGNAERKTLSNITNTMKPAGGATSKPSFILSDAENSSSKPLQSTVKKPLSARVPLRNITNENGVVNPSPGNAPKDLKQTIAKAKAGAPKLEAPKAEQLKPWSKYNKPLADPDLEKLVQEWAEEGIELPAGKSGDDLEDLRKEQADREIEERVAAIRNFRMPLPSFLKHYDDSMEMRNVLEMDPYEDQFARGADPEVPFPEMDWGKPSGLSDDFLVYSCTEEDIPGVPDNWSLVKSPPSQKPELRKPAARTWR